MKIIEQAVSFSGEDLILTNQRALYWPRKRALVLSDLHLGKAAHFRKNGIALPAQVSVQDLNRLDLLIDYYQAMRIIIAGDLVHAGANKEVEMFSALTGKYPCTEFILVRGNHDRFPENRLKAIGITAVYQDLFIDPVRFVHHQKTGSPDPMISGHVHPGISVQLTAGMRMRFPCFILTANLIILPAFSLFTGLDTSAVPENAVCYAFHEGGIFKVG